MWGAATGEAGNLVKLALVGRDECQARLARVLPADPAAKNGAKTGAVAQYAVERWRIRRMVNYKDLKLAQDAESTWSSMWATVRNSVLVPMVGDRVFQPFNRDESLTQVQAPQFPFYKIDLEEVVGDSGLVRILIGAHRETPSDFDTEAATKDSSKVEFQTTGQFESGTWDDVHRGRSFKIILGPRACASYEATIGGPAREVPGLGLQQFCAWLKSRPELPASKAVTLVSQSALGFIEGSQGHLKFVAPSVEGELTLQSE